MQSQNGAAVIATDSGEAFYGSPDLTTKVIPGTNGVKYLGGVRVGDVDVVLRYSGAWWNANIEPVVQSAGNWGYDFRSIRGQSSGYSNHASGTATDTNAAQHPLGTRTLGAAKLAKLAQLRDALRGVVRYGAFYSGRVDEMHGEIQDFGPALADLAADIRAGRMAQNFEELLDGSVRDNIPGHPATPTYEDDDMALSDEALAQIRQVVNEEVATVLRAEGVSGAAEHDKAAAAVWAHQFPNAWGQPNPAEQFLRAIDEKVTDQPPKPAPVAKVYTVVSGDTVSGIAKRFGITPEQLRGWNGLDPAKDADLRIGLALKVSA